jgi:NAD(P)-dependent dehydrogenase (short-subunit alcohol dehydrogenase family)
MAAATSYRLDQLVAVVTGGAGGIGGTTARALASAGAKVIIADLDEASSQRAVDEIGGEARALQVDVSSEVSVNALFDEIAMREGTI